MAADRRPVPASSPSTTALRQRLAALPPDRLPALLASAAIAFLVRRDRPRPLAGYFPEPGGAQPPFDDAFFPAARDFITGRLDDIAAVCAGRRYQMNEVARCTQVALGIAAVTGPGRDPVALIDLGTGAGLGLNLDRYRYRVAGASYGPPGARVALDCEVRGTGRPPPARLPPIAARAGIEVHPVDLRDPAARGWLEACAPPEASALTRLAAAIEVARRHPGPVIAGDAVDALPGLLGDLPRPGAGDRGRRLPGRLPGSRAPRPAGRDPGRRGPGRPGDLAVPRSPGPARPGRA